jgi:hypothetical protein
MAEKEVCQLWICLEGEAKISGNVSRPGEVWYLSATGEVKAQTDSLFLRTFVPAKSALG